MLTHDQITYLKSRGYTEELIRSEGILGIDSDEFYFEGSTITNCKGYIGWIVRSMSGQFIGIQVRALAEKRYRWFQAPGTTHLPVAYATENDYQLMWDTRTAFITEGAFDRIALKRAFPDRAIVARFSKGAGNQLGIFFRRHVDSLWTAFDSDEPGLKATEKTEKSLGGDLKIYDLKFPAKDLGLFLEKAGLSKVRDHIQRQITMQEF